MKKLIAVAVLLLMGAVQAHAGGTSRAAQQICSAPYLSVVVSLNKQIGVPYKKITYTDTHVQSEYWNTAKGVLIVAHHIQNFAVMSVTVAGRAFNCQPFGEVH